MSVAAPPRPSTASNKGRPARRTREECTRLGSYAARRGREREIVSVPAAGGSTLVIDREVLTGLDERLVAHLSSDEPAVNMRLLCAMYLADEEGRYCRRVTAEDRERTPPAAHAALGHRAHRDAEGCVHQGTNPDLCQPQLG